MRGIIPAAVLTFIEETIRQPVYRYFDLMTGTSTGAIIALGLSLGKKAEEILGLYEKLGAQVFSQSWRKAFRGLLTPKYSNKILLNTLKEFFGENTPMNDAKCRLSIPAVDIVNGKTIVFKTHHLSDYRRDYKLPMWKIAAATSAAPGYFPSYSDNADLRGVFVDGGLWANNPSYLGIEEGKRLGHDLADIRVLSLGCGRSTFRKDPRITQTFGLLGWGTSIIQLAFLAQSQGTEFGAGFLIGKENYFRIERQLHPKDSKLDDAENLDVLKSMGFDLGKTESKRIIDSFFSTQVAEFQPLAP